MDLITVAIRIKPCHNIDRKSIELISDEPPVVVIPERQMSFSFDNIFSEEASQEDIYKKMVQPFVQHVQHGYNATIFAYGPTGSGKTYTIGTDVTYHYDTESGLITRALHDIMSWNGSGDGNQIVTVSVSFIEIYNEKVYDLLGKNKTALQIKGFNVSGVKKQQVLTLQDAQNMLIEGSKNRHTGETKQNSKSSRSHAIFTIYCNVKHDGQETEAKLNLVDLAGSESVKKTGNEGSQLHEGININKGLLCIGQVINALSNNHSHVPFRQSTITTILQDSLNKKNYVALIACIGTKPEDLTETIQTLDFAQRAKRVKNKPEVNSILGEYNKSCTNVRNTPYKLCASTPHQNKFAHRTPLNHNSVNILQKRQAFKFHSTSNLSVIPSCASMSMVNEIPDSLSPIVRKCMEVVSETLLKRVENIVSDIMTPLQRSHSPRISRRSLERMVTNIVRNNMTLAPEFQTFRNEIDSNRAASACRIDYDDAAEKENQAAFRYVAQQLNIGRSSPIVSGNKTPSFKKPRMPMMKRAVPPRKSLAASSPIQESTKRRSMRIGKRQSSRKMEDNVCFNVSSSQSSPASPNVGESSLIMSGNKTPSFKKPRTPLQPQSVNIKRRSVRISKRLSTPTKMEDSISFDILSLYSSPTSPNVDGSSLIMSGFKTSPFKKPRTPLQPQSINIKRRSVRIKKRLSMALKENNVSNDLLSQSVRRSKRISIRNTQHHEHTFRKSNMQCCRSTSPKKRKKTNTLKTQTSIPKLTDSVHTRKVLKMLNEGKVHEIMSLRTIGAKYAGMIRDFRKFKGHLNKIADLSDMPWRGNGYRNFLTANFLEPGTP